MGNALLFSELTATFTVFGKEYRKLKLGDVWVLCRELLSS
jgi:hypothetical protein